MIRASTLDRFKENPALLEIYIEGLRRLRESGVLTVLRENAEPRIISDGKDINIQATQAARSAGYFECLNDLLNFKENFILERPSLDNLPLEYGATERTLSDGDLTKEEIDALRRGESPKYSARPITE